MAKPTRYPKWGIAAIAGGVCLTAIEVYGAVSYLVSQEQPHYLVAGGAVVTVVAAILPILAGRCWGNGRYVLASLLWLALVPALSVILCAAVERTGGAKDTADRDRQAIALRAELARSAVKDAKTRLDAAEAAVLAETKSGGCKTICEGFKEEAKAARKALSEARNTVAQAGVVPRDPMAARLAAVLPVSEAGIALYQPLVLPLAISALGLLLITVGAHTPKRRKALKRKGKPRRRKSKPRARKLPTPLPANVALHPRRK
jgi:hypothetical protein